MKDTACVRLCVCVQVYSVICMRCSNVTVLLNYVKQRFSLLRDGHLGFYVLCRYNGRQISNNGTCESLVQWSMTSRIHREI